MSNIPTLPQNDSDRQKRKENLQENQSKYTYKYDYESLNGVPMADGIPHGEKPKLKWVFKAIKIALKLAKNRLENKLDFNDPDHRSIRRKIIYDLSKFELKLLLSGDDELEALESLAVYFMDNNNPNRPENIEDYEEYFKSLKLPLISSNFEDDVMFARMRVAGQNPGVIKKVLSLDENFPVTDAIFQSIDGFENDTLAKASNESRLFMLDYKELKDIENANTGSGQKYSYAPKALFALVDSNTATNLKPIAIQCTQLSGVDSPLFTPNDGFAWKIAKTIVQIADFNHHELVTHLGATHLLIEPFVVTTHRQLADSHPLKTLLLPHFEGTIFINYFAQKKLVSDDGPFYQLFSGTMPTNRKVVATRLQQSFNDAMLPVNIKERGVSNAKLLYPYRDDAIKIWDAISNWVSAYLDIYYQSDEDIVQDTELRAWTEELVSKGMVKGFGNDGNGLILTLEYLKEAVTMVIFTSSAQHAAVNFTQRDFAGYTPNMPAAGYTPAPTNTNKMKEDWLNLLPPLNMSDSQVDLLQALSGVYYTVLGKYKRRYFKDKKVLQALNQFEIDLEDIEEDIELRNSKADLEPYFYMLPSKIPQSINI